MPCLPCRRVPLIASSPLQTNRFGAKLNCQSHIEPHAWNAVLLASRSTNCLKPFTSALQLHSLSSQDNEVDKLALASWSQRRSVFALAHRAESLPLSLSLFSALGALPSAITSWNHFSTRRSCRSNCSRAEAKMCLGKCMVGRPFAAALQSAKISTSRPEPTSVVQRLYGQWPTNE